MSTIPRAVILAVVFGLLMVIPIASPSAGQPQIVKRTAKQDVEELNRLTAGGNVTIYLNNNPATLKGMPSGSIELFGKRFLIMTKTTGSKTLVSFDAIAAIQGD